MLSIVLAFIVMFIGWVILNWALAFIPNDYIYIKLIITFIINALYGIFFGKYIGRKLLYSYLKKIYKDKDLTEEQ